MAKRVKICPRCGYHNDEEEDYCINTCPTSLINVPVTALEEIETRPVPEAIPHPMPPSPAPVTGEAVTMRMSTEASLECLSAPGFKFTVQPNATIGRQATINVKPVPNSQYISRRHATFLHEAGNWYIRDENSTEGTSVNGIKLAAGTKQPLKNGDTIALAITTFAFRSTP